MGLGVCPPEVELLSSRVELILLDDAEPVWQTVGSVCCSVRLVPFTRELHSY